MAKIPGVDLARLAQWMDDVGLGTGPIENVRPISGGTQILSGANTYTGGTSIASGATLQMGDGGTGGTIVGNIADAGTLAFNYSSPTTFKARRPAVRTSSSSRR